MWKSILKNLYSALALFAFINFTILSGLIGHAYLTGKIDRDKVDQMAAIIHGEESIDQAEEVSQGDAVAGGPMSSTKTSASKIREAIQQEDMDRLKRERAQVDLLREQTMQDRGWIKLEQKQKQFEQRKATYAAQQKKKREQELSSSFLEAVASIGGMKPKNALSALMNRTENEAVKLLSKLGERKRNRILDACKNQNQTMWRDRMFDLMLKQRALASGTGQ